MLTRAAHPSDASAAEEALPPPPYATSGVDYLAIFVRYDRPTVEALLAGTGLRPAPGLTGGFSVLSAPFGWGIVLRHGILRAAMPAADGIFAGLFSRAPGDVRRGVLPRPDNKWPLLVSVLSLPASGNGGPTRNGDVRVVVFTDPGAAAVDASGEIMRHLGLTPAEARVATLIGSGLSPKDAATVLDRAESTVRCTLKQVFSKLSINRQSKLAALVARVSALPI